jgi:hypothetical protein
MSTQAISKRLHSLDPAIDRYLHYILRKPTPIVCDSSIRRMSRTSLGWNSIKISAVPQIPHNVVQMRGYDRVVLWQSQPREPRRREPSRLRVTAA